MTDKGLGYPKVTVRSSTYKEAPLTKDHRFELPTSVKGEYREQLAIYTDVGAAGTDLRNSLSTAHKKQPTLYGQYRPGHRRGSSV